MTRVNLPGDDGGGVASQWGRLLRYGPRNRALWLLWKLACALVVGGVFAWIYFSISQITIDRSHDLMTWLDADIPFIPWTWWVYFPGYLLGLLVAVLALRDMRVFYRVLVTVLLSGLLCVAVFFMFPSTFPRPTYAGTGLTGEALRWFWSVDPPNNTFPSSHVAISVVAALGMWKDKNRLRFVNYLLTAGVAVTVLTIKQHYIIDVFGGFVVSSGAFGFIFRLWPVERREGSKVEGMVMTTSDAGT